MKIERSKEKNMVAAKSAKLKQIADEIEHCKICKKGKVGKPVPGEGNPDADIVFIGEAPGKLESETGRPFVGRAGKLLRELISEAGLAEDEVFITSPVKYLPKYVTPKLKDIEHGCKHLSDQLKVIEPKLVVLLGNVACQAVLKDKFLISKDHGRKITRDGVSYLISYHPAAPLHNPKVRNNLKNDFKKIKKILHKNGI